MDDYKDHYFETGGCRLHYVTAGEGPLLFFYHGFPLFWYSFHHQMDSLKNHYRVVSVDGPGVNLSSKPEDLSLYKLENLAFQIDELAMHIAGDEKFYLVGHDWGGALAWSYAQAYPERLEKVVAINAPPTNQLLGLLETHEEQQKRSSYMWSMRSGKRHAAITENGAHLLWQNAYAPFRKLPHYTDKDDEIFRKGLAQPGAIDGGINWYRANIPDLDQITDNDYWPSKSARTEVPALLIWGESDQAFVTDFIDDLDRYAGNSEIVRLPGIGHTPMLEAPDLTNRILRRFLEKKSR